MLRLLSVVPETLAMEMTDKWRDRIHAHCMKNMCMHEYIMYAKEEHFLDAVTGGNTSSIQLKKFKL